AVLQVDMQGRISNLSLHSTLHGMSLALPQPLHKSGGEKRPLVVKIKDKGQVALSYGNIAHVDMSFTDKRLRREVIRLGESINATAPTGDGLWLAGRIDTFPVQAWFDTLQKLHTPTADNSQAQTPSLPFLGARLVIQTLRFNNRRVESVRLHIDRS